MHVSALITLLPLLAFTSASPTPLQKRYTQAKIRAGRDGLCLTAAPKTGIGSEVFTTNCANALTWTINPGSGSILLGDGSGSPPLALDAGDSPGNNGALKVWQSYPGLYQQTWYLTDDNRIAITGGDQCLDEGDNGVQTYQCTTGNTNQVWYIDTNGSPQPSASSSATPQPSASASPDYPIPDVPKNGNIAADPASGGRRIRIAGRDDLCVTVQHGFNGRGTDVAMYVNPFCAWAVADAPAPGASPTEARSLMSNCGTYLPEGGSGQIKVHANPNLCLDAGENVANGNPITIYDCLDVPQQQWTWGENGLLQVNNNQCLDVRKESTSSYNKPYIYEKSLQTWACSSSDPYQQFALYSGPDVTA